MHVTVGSLKTLKMRDLPPRQRSNGDLSSQTIHPLSLTGEFTPAWKLCPLRYQAAKIHSNKCCHLRFKPADLDGSLAPEKARTNYKEKLPPSQSRRTWVTNRNRIAIVNKCAELSCLPPENAHLPISSRRNSQSHRVKVPRGRGIILRSRAGLNSK